MHVPLKVTLLNITQDPGELIEQVASISYVTQRFFDRTHPARVIFKSGRIIPLKELNLSYIPKPGDVIPGFVKDDVCVARVEDPSYYNVVRWLRKLGHWKLFCMPNATFLIEGISRKSALHYLRYEFLITNMQSQKYQPQNSFNYVLPDIGEESLEDIAKLEGALKQIQFLYEGLRATKLDPEWARGVYCNLTAQKVTISTNFLQWEHICRCLLPETYVNENRKVAIKVINILKKEAPVFFEDFVEKGDGSWRVPSITRNVCVNFGLGPTEKRKLGIPVIEIESDEDIP